MSNRSFSLGALTILVAIAAGAFGAHALRERLEPRALEIFEVAVRYQVISGIGLLFSAWAADRWGGTWPRRASLLILVCTVIFSGSLYALALSGVRQLGAITPIGGLAMMLGWLCLALSPRGPS